MKNTIIVLLFLMPLSVLAQRTIDFRGLIEDKEIYYYQNKPFTGKSIRKHKNGKKAQEANWENGKLHGLKTEWNSKGILREKMNFYLGDRHGAFYKYYDKGELKMEGNYDRGVLHGNLKGFYRSGLPEYNYNYEYGVKDGISTTYFDFNGEQTYANTGNLEQKVTFKNGKPHGELNSYYRAGNPRKKLFYNMGVLNGIYKSWHVNGLLAEEMYYNNGKLDSLKRVWDNLLGNLIKEEYYSNGIKSGTWIDCNQLGDTVLIKNYENDSLNGDYLEFMDGKIETIGKYVNGEKHGIWKTGLISNQRHAEGEYIYGQKIGTWWYYDAEGKKLLEREFDKEGYIIKEKLHNGN